MKDEVVAWIYSYLTNRKQTVWIDHVYSEFIETNIGVPQGSILGPLLFLVFFNDLPEIIFEDIDCYADDNTLSSSNKNVKLIEENLNRDCTVLSNWMT